MASSNTSHHLQHHHHHHVQQQQQQYPQQQQQHALQKRSSCRSKNLADYKASISRDVQDPTKVVERTAGDRVCSSRPEEDRRRRTILVQREGGSFGFTIQSYGIHYKKDAEIEIITYVDFVEFGGPSFRAGMREGDVILSINGQDLEKANHKTLVTFIQNCGERMRAVVLFEDCVHKVELHLRYIKLQRMLHDRLMDLERLCHQEKALLAAWRAQGIRIPADLVVSSRVVASSQQKDHQQQQKQQPPPQQKQLQKLKPQSQQQTQKYQQQHQRHHSQHYTYQQQQQQQQRVQSQQPNVNSFPRSTSGVLFSGRPTIATQVSMAGSERSNAPCRVTLYGKDTHGVERGFETLVPPPQFRLVPVTPPSAASWHLHVTAGQTQQQRCHYMGHNESAKKIDQGNWQQEKPRSWDNLLSTRSFGGYGFGYGFIDVSSSRTSTNSSKDGRSVSTNRLNEEKNDADSDRKGTKCWTGTEGSRTVPRRLRTTASSVENLVSPLDVSSCFSCDCIGVDHHPLDGCMFNKPKSTESLLAVPIFHPVPSETSLADNVSTTTVTTQRRRSRTSSLAKCLGRNKHSPTDQMTHL